MRKPGKQAILARSISLHVRNSKLEDLHADGKITEQEMRELMLEIEYNIAGHLGWLRQQRIISFPMNEQQKDQLTNIFFGPTGISWDNPQLSKRK
jgi:hypothetical protein